MNPSDVAERLRDALEGRYQILRLLGEGGMAVVFLARDLKHERQVAIKVLRPGPGFEIGGTRFLREIRVTAQLSHPHIVPLLDSGEAGGLLFFVMPLVQGETLRARLLRERQLPVGLAVQIATQIAGALAHAHARGILHRDIKPENVMLSDGQALVTDFGIARAVAAGDEARHTVTGVAIGTPAYMSPEQATGEGVLDARSDLYSLACVMYEMLVGEPPFTGPTAHAILARRLAETPRPVRAARESVNAAIEAVIARALSRLPADRQDSVEQFASELRAATAAVEVPANRARRGRVIVGVTAVLALTGILLWQRPRTEESTAGSAAGPVRLAVLPLENLGGAEDAPFTDGMTEEIMSRLSEIGALQVVSRTSARRFRGTSLSMREVGTELGADYVLEGTVRTDRGGSGGTARVAARLIRAADDVRVWQQTFDAALVPGEILIVQAGIATQVAAALNVRLGASEERRVTRVTTQDSAAYRLFQLGRFQWEKRDAASLQQAINHFRDAVTRDPTFADAHAGLSDAIGATVLLYGNSHSASYDENRRLALTAARRAVALDSALAAAHASLGFGLFFFEWDFVAAEQSFTRAIRIDPEYGPARYWYTQLLWVLGRFDEALAQSQAAVAADPLSAVAFLARARSYRLIGREADWVADLRRTTELQSALPVPWFDLAEYHATRGSVDSARSAGRRFLELRFGRGVQDETVVALVDALAGSGSLEKVVRAHQQEGTPDADGLLARLYALRGQNDSAFARLQRLETSRSVELMLALPFVEPLLAQDRRWAELRARLRI